MLKKQNRLIVRRDLKLNKKLNSSLFTVKYNTNNIIHSRFGFVIAKTIDKRAVVRNKIKRNFMAGINNILSLLPGGMDFLFIIRKEAKGKSASEIQDQITRALGNKKLVL